MKQSFLWLALSVSAFSINAAAQNHTELNQSATNAFEYAESRTNNSLTDLSDEDRSLARQWMLTEQDWVKYKRIMTGPRGIWSPGLDPLTALGVMETDPSERRRYAEIWMRMEIRRSELELAFEVERMSASERILRGIPVVQNQSWIDNWNTEQNARTHDVNMFVSAECTEKCADLYTEVLGSTGSDDKARLNIFFPTGTTAEQIGQWAQTIGIPTDIVQSRKVTLNFDEGQFARYDVLVADLPEVRVVNLKTGDVQKTFTRY